MGLVQTLLKVVFYAAIGAVLCIAGAAYFFMTWEPDRDDFPLRGIDVSHHQGVIDWALVSGDDVAFAYIKASEGGDFQDSAFLSNWNGAAAVGLARGAYHFFSLCKGGPEQARNFLRVLPKDGAMLPPVLDLEFEGNCPRRPPVEEVLQDISAFVTAVEQATGRRVMIYAPKDFHLRYLKDHNLNRQIWARSLWRSPDYVPDWTVWQYHQRGAIRGIDGDVDLNILNAGITVNDLLENE
ncbi:MAG: glycoside hydrolase family 25 protein [Roseibium sp.]|nr:glycoside hydrolase family 25 protein [Roseibium sp.]